MINGKSTTIKNAICVFLIFFLLIITNIYSASESKPQWLKGTGSASGTDFEAMRLQALNSARRDALSKAGIVLRSLSLLKEESQNNNTSDFYTQFTESSTRGLILEERNLVIGDPIRISPPKDKINIVYKIEVQLETLIALQNTTPDPTFTVTLRANKETYRENEPVSLTIKTPKNGYLTLFHVQDDSLSVLFPNALSKTNSIFSNKSFVFPDNEAYSLELSVVNGHEYSMETFIAVITKNDISFPGFGEQKIEKGYIKTNQDLLTTYTNWLYKIPVDQRCSDIVVLKVKKRP
jgi:hypothetical protein